MNVWPFPAYPIGGACAAPVPKPAPAHRNRDFGPWKNGREMPTQPGVYQRIRAKMMKAYDYFDGEIWLAGGENRVDAKPTGRMSTSQCVKWREVLEKVSI